MSNLTRNNWHEGKTAMERQAAFNGCQSAFVIRDSVGATRDWCLMYGDHKTASGFSVGNGFRTLKEAVAVMREAFPSLPHYRVWLARTEGREGFKVLK